MAAFYCVIFGFIAAPFAYGSGLADWKTRFNGRHTPIFDSKIIFGALFIVVTLVIIALRVAWPEVASEGGLYSIVYLIMVYAATGLAAYLGHLGSKFI